MKRFSIFLILISPVFANAMQFEKVKISGYGEYGKYRCGYDNSIGPCVYLSNDYSGMRILPMSEAVSDRLDTLGKDRLYSCDAKVRLSSSDSNNQKTIAIYEIANCALVN